MKKEVYIVEALRTAIGSFSGSLANVSAVDLGVTVCAEISQASKKADPANVDEVLMENVLSAGLGQNIARQIAVKTGIPVEKTAMTVNMVCGSGLRAVATAVQSILCGDADMILAGGTESMSNAPYLLPKARSGYRMGHGSLVDSMIQDGLWDIFNDVHMVITAENLAEKYGISRQEQDVFAANSQNKTEKAWENNRFCR